MRSIKLFLTAAGLMVGIIAIGQPMKKKTKGFWSKSHMTIGPGFANYYGDLTENFHIFNQSGYSVSVGLNYRIIPHLNARADVSFMKIGAKDSKSSRKDLQARNLSFKSFIWDASLAVEYDVFNLDNYKVTPYIFAGFGVFYFNPYTKDVNGYKQYLQYLGTEGQGLAIYPERKFYKRVEFEVPIGGGLKWAVSKKVNLAIEYKFRHTNTDYIDDVSRSGYPNKTALDARNPRTATLTWRGGEVGSGPYPPANTQLNRGNPKKNDVFYTTQLKVMIHL